MKAINFEQYGAPDVLRLVDVDRPVAGLDQVLIAVRAAGVNRIDGKVRAGSLQEFMPLDLPAGAGLDAAGIVVDVGSECSDIQVGDRVFGSGASTYAEYAVLDTWAVIPPEMTFEQAAALPLPVETALRLLGMVELHAGDTIFVSGASGGVGSMLVQIARMRELTVIGTSNADHLGHVEQLGGVALDYESAPFTAARDLVNGPVAAAFDLAGNGVISELIELTGSPQRVVSIADFAAAAQGAQVTSEAGDPAGACAWVSTAWSARQWQVPIAATFDLADAAAAQAMSDQGHTAGRIVLSVGSAERGDDR